MEIINDYVSSFVQLWFSLSPTRVPTTEPGSSTLLTSGSQLQFIFSFDFIDYFL